MPRVSPGILAPLGAIIIAATLAVLYVIRPVHDRPPPALASLVADPSPKALPAAMVVDPAGHAQSLAQFKGHVVILNMWATWCAPCVRELPALGRLEAALGRGDVKVVTVNAGSDTAAETLAFLKAHAAANLPAYRDPDRSLLFGFGSQGLPFSVLIDANGREIARASGPMQWDDPAAIAYFKSLGARASS